MLKQKKTDCPSERFATAMTARSRLHRFGYKSFILPEDMATLREEAKRALKNLRGFLWLVKQA